MTYKPSPKQRANLKQLADFLAAGGTPELQFDMAEYMIIKLPSGVLTKTARADECGTVACALGHGPAAGVKPKNDEFWFNYCERAFGIGPNSDEWDWCFSSEWEWHDNTRQGAAQRIYRLLETGHPGTCPWDEEDNVEY